MLQSYSTIIITEKLAGSVLKMAGMPGQTDSYHCIRINVYETVNDIIRIQFNVY
jgi:hypothetical protein